MKKQLRLLLFVLVAFLSYISCRKIDVISKPEEEQNNFTSTTDKFFNQHRTKDPTEKALIDFLSKKNEKLHFVDKTISQIGFPRWDKAITKGRNNAIGGRGSTLSDTTSTFYIPFVRDSQNYVNAALVVKAAPSDTSFSYLCDWQYSHRQNTTTSVSDSAEYLAVFFMMLDKEVFGHTQFSITDINLFNDGNHEPVYVQLRDNNIGTIAGRSNLVPVDYCQNVTITFVDCPYQGRGSCTPVCDRCPLCMSSISYDYCWTEWEDDGGGGYPGGGGGGGEGGGGEGGGTPPDCGGGTPGGEPGGNYKAMRLPDGCGPGWEPTEDDDIIAWFESTPNYNIDTISNSIGPCGNGMISAILSQNNSTIKIIKELFSESTKFNLIFEVDSNINSAARAVPSPLYETRQIGPWKFVKLDVKIKINPYILSNSTKMSAVESIIHEMIHGYFFYRQSDAYGDPLKESKLANDLGFLKPFDPNAPTITYGAPGQHEQMSASYIDKIAESLKEYYLINDSDLNNLRNSSYPNLSINNYYKAMAWGGLTENYTGNPVTKAWQTLKTNDSSTAAMYQFIISAEQNGTPDAPSHIKCQ